MNKEKARIYKKVETLNKLLEIKADEDMTSDKMATLRTYSFDGHDLKVESEFLFSDDALNYKAKPRFIFFGGEGKSIKELSSYLDGIYAALMF